MTYRPSDVTHRCVIGRNVEEDFRGTPAAHISVAVPHTCYQVRLTTDIKENRHYWMDGQNPEDMPSPKMNDVKFLSGTIDI